MVAMGWGQSKRPGQVFCLLKMDAQEIWMAVSTRNCQPFIVRTLLSSVLLGGFQAHSRLLVTLGDPPTLPHASSQLWGGDRLTLPKLPPAPPTQNPWRTRPAGKQAELGGSVL